MRWTLVDSPIGDLLLTGSGSALCGLHMQPVRPPAGAVRDDDAFAVARQQLAEYFAGERTAFDLPLAMDGTEFQRRVWTALCQIPYGETTTYGELARELGLGPRGARAVGLANGRNPIAVVVPCHRVIGADGGLTGFGGGLGRKRALLELEAGATALF